MSKRRILLVEDEQGLAMTLRDRLEAEGYEVDSCADGNAAVAAALKHPFDLIVLDIMLPGRSGFDVCRDIRAQGLAVPVLMLTARGQVADRVLGLRIGADDYLTKPFDMLELTARIEALLRRASSSAAPGAGRIEFGDILIDTKSGEVRRAGLKVPLSTREYQLLVYLAERANQVIPRDTLLTEVWGYSSAVTSRTVDVHMAWLRQKIEPNPAAPRYLVTLRGLGYKLATGDPRS
ncbi:MAG: response regulator transcription factor [Bryobacteraceae bacterium]|nr:response regulator transcription factor [Bryobacteraceae bacterium]